MTLPSPFETLLDKLHRGDAAAAEEVFRAYEPLLRVVVRRQLSAALRSKFDSTDIVQSVWADLLTGFRDATWRFPDAEHLRAFLVRVTRNRFLDHLRRHLTEMERAQPLLDSDADGVPPSPEPDPSEVLQADELWEELVSLCPPGHVEVLRLRRLGRPLAEIAAETGLHESSVRRILYDLARRLALRRGRRGD